MVQQVTKTRRTLEITHGIPYSLLCYMSHTSIKQAGQKQKEASCLFMKEPS